MIEPGGVAPNRTALLLIDIQVDFGAQGGAMARQGKDMTAPHAAVAKAAALAEAARGAGVLLVFARLLTQPGVEARGTTCVEGTRGADFIGPQPQAGDLIVSKPCFSAFADASLAGRLRAAEIDTLILAGLTTECCVQASAWAAFELDFHVILASDACAAYEEDLHRHALRALELSGATLAASAELATLWAK